MQKGAVILERAELQAKKDTRSPEQILREVMEACADCDSCRYLMQDSCLFFPELYRLYDRGEQELKPAKPDELLRMADLCTYCGLCPCEFVPQDVFLAKARDVQKQGLDMGTRVIAHVQSMGKLGAFAPGLVQSFLKLSSVREFAKRLTGVHPSRELPEQPKQSFFAWAKKRDLHKDQEHSCQVAYFAGCSAGYFFPEVARCTVKVLEQSSIQVFVPQQECCGMPAYLEGDAHYALQKAKYNLQSLQQAVDEGYTPVFSCPTCSFMFRVLLKARAVYSNAYQDLLQAKNGEVIVPDAQGELHSLKKALAGNQLKDEGYFSGLDPLQRISLGQNILDMGEYLQSLFKNGSLDTNFGKLNWDMVHFVPCHQREQAQGGHSPYQEILSMIPGLRITRVGGIMDCCGMGGNKGFKQDFHQESIELAGPLLRKIRAAKPQGIITECLSCRLQFEHLLDLPVLHPLQVLSKAYAAG
ncbi:MAG: heterodisulfide reductase-related iron-sulfur binding cluster, partial [Desulfohalobiaceae bacterium]